MAIKLKGDEKVQCTECGDTVTAAEDILVHRHPEQKGLFLCELCFEEYCERNEPEYD